MPTLRLGTRGSALALSQGEIVRKRLVSLLPGWETRLEIFQTTGDRLSLDPSETATDPKTTQGLFTRELDQALLAGQVETCVHSLKDLPTVLCPGIVLAAVLERGDSRDAVVASRGGSFRDLPNGSRVGTSSPRRTAFLRHARPDVTVVPLRGNLDTRLRKLREGLCDAILVASAGLSRLGRLDEATDFLEPPDFLPSPGQGALCLTVRSDDGETARRIKALEHPETRTRVEAERSFLRHLQGGCSVPVGALARLEGEDLTLWGAVASLDGSEVVRSAITGAASRAVELGRLLAEECLSKGAEEILKNARCGGE